MELCVDVLLEIVAVRGETDKAIILNQFLRKFHGTLSANYFHHIYPRICELLDGQVGIELKELILTDRPMYLPLIKGDVLNLCDAFIDKLRQSNSDESKSKEDDNDEASQTFFTSQEEPANDEFVDMPVLTNANIESPHKSVNFSSSKEVSIVPAIPGTTPIDQAANTPIRANLTPPSEAPPATVLAFNLYNKGMIDASSVGCGL